MFSHFNQFKRYQLSPTNIHRESPIHFAFVFMERDSEINAICFKLPS